MSRHHHDARRIIDLAQRADDLKPIHARQLEVNDNDVRLDSKSGLQAHGAVAGDFNQMPFLLEKSGNVFCQNRFVFNHQKRGHPVYSFCGCVSGASGRVSSTQVPLSGAGVRAT